MVLMDEHTPPLGASSHGVGHGRRRRVLSESKKGEKNLFLPPLCKLNNRSSAVGNDSQNGIHCRRWATIIYELTKDIVTNNIVAQLYF